jgi:Helix-turn-helix domain
MTVAIKQRAHELIEALPDDATWWDLLHAVELRTDVEAGLADAKARAAHRSCGAAPGLRVAPMRHPRVSALMRGKIDVFRLDALVNMAAGADLRVALSVQKAV